MGATKERMLREMGDALGALAHARTVVLLLEDLHWADASSADLLRHLCQRIGAQSVLVLATFRPEDLESGSHPLKNYRREMLAHRLCEEIALGMLSPEHIAGYLTARFSPNNFPPDFASTLQAKTEGLPLFARSLLEFLADRGDIAEVNDCWTLARPVSDLGLEVPASVRSMIRKTIDALSEDDRRALQYASVAGEEFLSTVLAKLLGTDEIALEERLDRLDKVHHLIHTLGEEELPDGSLATRYRFGHSLYKDVLYSDVVHKRRILLHREAGEHLVNQYGNQARSIAVQLALHFELGRDFGRAIEHYIQAGDNATRLYATGEAEQHYSRALGLIERLPPEEQTRRYFTICQKRGEANLVLSRFAQAADDFKSVLRRARAAGAAPEESLALNSLAKTYLFSHRVEDLAACVEEILPVAERSGSRARRIEAVAGTALKHLCFGELSQAKPLLDQSIASAREAGHHQALLEALIWRGLLHSFQSEYNRGEELLVEAVSLASDTHRGMELLNALFALGLNCGNAGKISQALEAFDKVVKMAQRNGDRFWFPRVANCQGWLYRELEDLDHAMEHDQQGIAIAREHHVLEAETNSLINLGLDYAHAIESDKPVSAFRSAQAIIERDGWFRWRFSIRLQAAMAQRWLAEDSLDQAEEGCRWLLESAGRRDAHKYIALAHKLLGEIAIRRGQLEAAKQELQTALGRLRDHPAPLLAWRAYAVLGRLHRQLRDSEKSNAAYSQAAEIIGKIAGNVTDTSLRERFLNSAAVREVFEF
jgi:tetratricopeptide (TPR) repeat protein